MIDRIARSKLSELIRSLVSGNITNDEFEEKIPDSEDAAIREIFSHGAWRLYSDIKEYKLKGIEALTSTDRSLSARWILFLRTDLEYKWPYPNNNQRFLTIVTLGIFGQSTLEKWQEYGDVDFWPFKDKNEFTIAKRNNGYLNDKSI